MFHSVYGMGSDGSTPFRICAPQHFRITPDAGLLPQHPPHRASPWSLLLPRAASLASQIPQIPSPSDGPRLTTAREFPHCRSGRLSGDDKSATLRGSDTYHAKFNTAPDPPATCSPATGQEPLDHFQAPGQNPAFDRIAARVLRPYVAKAPRNIYTIPAA